MQCWVCLNLPPLHYLYLIFKEMSGFGQIAKKGGGSCFQLFSFKFLKFQICEKLKEEIL